MVPRLFSIFLGLLLWTKANGDIIELSVKDHLDLLNSNEVWLVNYHAETCAECHKVLSLLAAAMTSIEGLGVKIGIFDVGLKGAKKIVGGMNQVPTVQLFIGAPQPNPYTGRSHRDFKVFPIIGVPSVNAPMLKKFVTDALPNHVRRISTGEVQPVLTDYIKKKTNAVVVLTERDKTSPMLKGLALKYMGRLVFAEVQVKPADTATLEYFKVEALPALVVLNSTKGASVLAAGETYSGERFTGDIKDPAAISAFVDAFVPPVQHKGAVHEEAKDGPKPGAVPGANLVADLTHSNFDSMVLESEDAWIVWFKEDEVTPSVEWDTFAAKSEGALHAGVVTCAKNQTFCKSRGYKPSTPFVAFPFGEDKADESKAFAAAAQAFQRAAESVPDKVRRPGMPLDNDIAATIGSGKYPMLALTMKYEPTLLLKSLALKLEDTFNVYIVSNPPQQLLQQFNNAPVPSIAVLLPTQPNPTFVPNQPMPPLQLNLYGSGPNAPIQFAGVVNFAMQVLAPINPTRAQGLRSVLYSRGRSGVEAAPAAGASSELAIVDSPEAWASVCSPTSAKLCVVGLLGGGAAFDEQVKTMREVTAAEAGSHGALTFAAANGACYTNFAQSFDAQPAMLPTVVVYSPKKERFASFVGTFAVEPIREFLRGVLSGRITTAPIRSTPVVDADISHCSNEAAAEEEVLPMEEEDIGDFMAEILAEEKKRKQELAEELKREAEERQKAEAEAAKQQAINEAKKKRKIIKKKKKAPAAAQKADDEL